MAALRGYVQWLIGVLDGWGQTSDAPVVDETNGTISWILTSDNGERYQLTAMKIN